MSNHAHFLPSDANNFTIVKTSTAWTPNFRRPKRHRGTAECRYLYELYESGLVIGKTGNPFTFRVVNDRLILHERHGGCLSSNNKLRVTQAEILSKLIISKFAFGPQTNGNLSLIYTG